jgi:copper chaperone
MSTTEEFTVKGMTCGHCVNAVTEELRAIDGVTEVEVDLESGKARVTSDSGIDRGTVAAAVDEAGYELA